MSIAGHSMDVIAVEGQNVQRTTVGSIAMYIGSRYDVIFCADQASHPLVQASIVQAPPVEAYSSHPWEASMILSVSSAAALYKSANKLLLHFAVMWPHLRVEGNAILAECLHSWLQPPGDYLVQFESIQREEILGNLPPVMQFGFVIRCGSWKSVSYLTCWVTSLHRRHH